MPNTRNRRRTDNGIPLHIAVRRGKLVCITEYYSHIRPDFTHYARYAPSTAPEAFLRLGWGLTNTEVHRVMEKVNASR